MITLDLDKVVAEWAYRTNRGYPLMDNSEDLDILDSILLEMYGVSYSDVFTEAAPKKEKPVKKEIDILAAYPKNLISALTKLNKLEMFREFISLLPEGTSGNTARSMVLTSLQSMCKTSSTAIELAKVFKSKASLQSAQSISFTDGIYNSLFKIQPSGIGPGEILISWLVRGATVQGPSKSFDIDWNGQHYEVKSLQDPAGGKPTAIDPAKYGKISSHKFTRKFQGFWEYILTPYYENKLRDSVISIVDDVKAQNKIKQLLDILETIPRTTAVTQDPIENSGEIRPVVFDSFYNAIVQINKLLPKSVKDKVASTSTISVKSKSTDAQYWIEPDDADDINKNAGKDVEISIKVGDKITDENKSAKIWFIRLLNNEFVRSPQVFIDSLRTIRDGFAVGKAGLIYFDNNQINISTGMGDFFTAYITRSTYRFDLKARKKYAGYEYQKAQ